MHSKYIDHANVAPDIFSTTPHGVGVEASSSIPQDVIGWRHSIITGETLREQVVVREFACANNGIMAGNNLMSDTTNTENYSELKKEADEKELHRLAKVHNVLDMW